MNRTRVMITSRCAGALCALLVLALSGARAAVQTVPSYESLDDLPVAVRKAFAPFIDNCEWHIDQLVVEAFGGELLYSIRCPSNHANQVRAFVLAHDAAGTNAAALYFPAPTPGEAPLDSLSNAERDGARRQISHTFINPEEPPCRTEARWRIVAAKPELLFWREARSCDGDGWVVRFDRGKAP